MAFGIRARGFMASALGHAADANRRSMVGATAGNAPVDAWLETLRVLARRRGAQREEWAAASRLRAALSQERER